MRSSTVFLPLFAVSLAACIGRPTGAAPPAAVLDELVRAEHTWAAALQARDSVALEAIMAHDFMLNGRVPKREWMANSLHRIVVDSIALGMFDLVATGGDTAVVDLDFYWRSTLDGRPAANTTHRLRDTWVRTAEGWRVRLRRVIQ